MLVFPCAKINLGLNVVARRSDGYHDLETIFYPIPLYDTLEVTEKDDTEDDAAPFDLQITGMELEGDPDDNLVVRAYRLLAQDHPLPKVHIRLHKSIPSQAGLGGGSSDAAYMLRVLNEMFDLRIDAPTLTKYAARIGADCAFFIQSTPAYATGIGDVLTPLEEDQIPLSGRYMVLVKPSVAVSTREAYSRIQPKAPAMNCVEAARLPLETWREHLTNDFEDSVFPLYPEIQQIKEQLYQAGAVYALMSGSGSAVFGIFNEEPEIGNDTFRGCQVFSMEL
ncbi:MAG: 4-(cytidine 5'-diphospho)-2-C-methyl-D-erythritol kinase [Prevotella sp.]|nr:4-(cytidine 5'-diphospho)-2-C-methyl-D-erythritol kinase [Prevotella sp.]